MPRTCLIDGKGNAGKFIERSPNICPAGVPSSQPHYSVPESFEYYSLQNEVDALVSDAIVPPVIPREPLRQPTHLEFRHRYKSGLSELINPTAKTKFQQLVEELKSTSYESYWKKEVGYVSDQTPLLPAGLNIYDTTFGKKTLYSESLYDVIMPVDPLPDIAPSRRASYQTDRNYCKPAFNPNTIFGEKTNQIPNGRAAKYCMTDESLHLGTALAKPVSAKLADFKDLAPRLAVALAPNDNISSVPKGHTFVKIEPCGVTVADCLFRCEVNQNKELIRKCLSHLNTIRKFLSKRYEPTFFKHLYSVLKHYDTDKSGWVHRDKIYEVIATKYIRIDPLLVEPLLSLWKAFDGSRIEYRTFVRVINFTRTSPEIPKIWDIPADYHDFSTTYSDMSKPGQELGNPRMAGVPSGRYLDLDYPLTPDYYCKAHRIFLPDETDSNICMSQSVFSILGLSHRDMFAARKPAVIRKVFEGAGEKFTETDFNTVWNEAKKHHSQGMVCYETFRRALEKLKIEDEKEKRKENILPGLAPARKAAT